MNSTFGKTFRKIRQEKNVSLTSLADKRISKSQISRFERGESEITFTKLIILLNKLNVSITEFLELDTSFSNKKDFRSLVKYIKTEYTAHRIDSLKSLLNDSLTGFERTMIKSIISTVDPSNKPSSQEIQELTDYLFKIDNWGYYEITLLGNCVRTINYSTYFLLSKEILKKHIANPTINTRLIIQLLINCLIQSIDNESYDNCTYLIPKISNLLKNELAYYEQTVFLYVVGYYKYKKHIASGKQDMLNALQIFTFLGEKNLQSQYQHHYANLKI